MFMRRSPEWKAHNKAAREALTDDVVLAAMDHNGAIVKYGEIVAQLETVTGIDYRTVYRNTDRVLRRMRHAGRVELIKGTGSGWRIRKDPTP